MNKADPVSASMELLVQLKTVDMNIACGAIVGKGCAGESTWDTYFREGRDGERLLRKSKGNTEHKRRRDGEERECSEPALYLYGSNRALHIEILDPNIRRTISKSHDHLVLAVWAHTSELNFPNASSFVSEFENILNTPYLRNIS